jgi:hypothetical protein
MHWILGDVRSVAMALALVAAFGFVLGAVGFPAHQGWWGLFGIGAGAVALPGWDAGLVVARREWGRIVARTETRAGGRAGAGMVRMTVREAFWYDGGGLSRRESSTRYEPICSASPMRIPSGPRT